MTNRMNIRRFAPAALVLAGVALGIAVSPMVGTPARAQSSSNEPPFNAAEQRKAMITQLTEMNARLGRIETKINSGLSVKVTEMPATKDQ